MFRENILMNIKDESLLKYTKTILFISLIVHLVCAVFSHGFHHFDEHFQIMEFAAYKMGKVAENVMPWELHREMRSWFQPAIVVFFQKVFSVFKIDNPFFLATTLRIFSAFIGWLSQSLLSLYVVKEFASSKRIRWYLLLLNFLWFIPYMQVRMSSENWGGCFFTAAIAIFLIYWNDNRKKQFISIKSSLLIGVLFGFSFLARFQMGVGVFAFFVWAVLFSKISFKNLLLILQGVFFVIVLGYFLDYWGYGNGTLSFYHYFAANLLEGKVSNFGIKPWWYYIQKTLSRGVFPISLLMLVGIFYSVIRKYKNAFVFSVVPFVLIHNLIGHKEIRFLFPIAPIIPLFMVFYFESLKAGFFEKKWAKYLITICIVINGVALIYASTKNANGAMSFYKYFYKQNISKLIIYDENPFSMVGLPVSVYRPESLVEIEQITSLSPGNIGYVFTNTGKKYFELINNDRCELEFVNVPNFALNYNIFNWIDRSRIWSLFNCK